MNKAIVSIFITAAIATMALFGITNNAFENGKFTCKHYILNTHLYVVLALVYIALSVQLLSYFKINLADALFKNVRGGGIIIFIALMGVIFGINYVNPEKVLLKHSLWLIFLSVIVLSFYPIYNMYKRAGAEKMINSALLTTLILVIAVMGTAFYRPDLVKLSWGPVLFFALLGVVLIEIIVLLTRTNMGKFGRVLNYVVIAIFIGFMLYDTKMIQVRAEKCLETCRNYMVRHIKQNKEWCIKPDYINESLNLFLDIWNLFLRILRSKSRR